MERSRSNTLFESQAGPSTSASGEPTSHSVPMTEDGDDERLKADSESELEDGEIVDDDDSPLAPSSPVEPADISEFHWTDYASAEMEQERRPNRGPKLDESCLRLIVRESELLELGSLILITITGALIGNSPECDLNITDRGMSRKHARISYNKKNHCYQIVDCNSKHGVFLNGRRLEVDTIEEITHGDILRLAQSEFLLHHHHGKEVTCDECEPGCVQAELLATGRLTKEEDDPLVFEDRQTVLKKLKKRYGVTWNRPSHLPQNYQDRAKKRRFEKGSDNPYEKTAEGTALDKPLNQGNKGFKILEKLGWSEGQGIGKEMAGDTQPLPLVSSEGRTGLGFGHS